MAKPVIVIVDDKPSDRGITKIVLETLELDVDVVELSDGKDLIYYFNRLEKEGGTQPSAVFVDISMRRVDGIEAISEIRATHGATSVPLIVLSDSRQRSEVDRAYEQGCSAYIHKPTSIDTYVEAFRRVFSTLADDFPCVAKLNVK